MKECCPFRYSLREFSNLSNHSMQRSPQSHPFCLHRVLGWGWGEGAVGRGIIPSWLLIVLRITSKTFIWPLRACKNHHLPSYCTHITWLPVSFLRSSGHHSGSHLRAFARAVLTRTVLQPLPWAPGPPNSSFRTLLKYPFLDSQTWCHSPRDGPSFLPRVYH